PHRLSDKLLKSVAVSALAPYCEVAYITLSSFRVNFFLGSFSPAIQLPEPLNPMTRKSLCRVDGVAL
ncbi:MAG: hypothetical protein WBW72_02665, partial [Erwinia billingiae]